LFVAASLASLPLLAHAQPAASGFVGNWQGSIEGVGEATLVITAVRPNGQVDGRMQFALHSHASEFGDKFDPSKNMSHGRVAGALLTIETPLGGLYDLQRNGDQLSGTYRRGTTYKVAVTFRKS
jgi:hypothetical protein